MNSDTTVIYYTNNREQAGFAAKAQAALLEAADGVPIISVSQKPIAIGRNIVVGEVGSSSQNTFRQMQIGASEAKTKFVCTAEADTIYPREYFTFQPPSARCAWYAVPLWCLVAKYGKARVFIPKRRGCIGAAVVPRDLLLRVLGSILDGLDIWGDRDERDLPRIRLPKQAMRLEIPVLTIKTDNGVHLQVPGYHGKVRCIPHWGTSEDVIRKYIHETL